MVVRCLDSGVVTGWKEAVGVSECEELERDRGRGFRDHRWGTMHAGYAWEKACLLYTSDAVVDLLLWKDRRWMRGKAYGDVVIC